MSMPFVSNEIETHPTDLWITICWKVVKFEQKIADISSNVTVYFNILSYF